MSKTFFSVWLFYSCYSWTFYQRAKGPGDSGQGVWGRPGLSLLYLTRARSQCPSKRARGRSIILCAQLSLLRCDKSSAAASSPVGSLNKLSLCWAFPTTADVLIDLVRSMAMCTHRNLTEELLSTLSLFIRNDAGHDVFLLQSITTSWVSLVFRSRLFTEHQATSLWTSSMYFVSSPPWLRPPLLCCLWILRWCLSDGRGHSCVHIVQTGRGSAPSPAVSPCWVTGWVTYEIQP